MEKVNGIFYKEVFKAKPKHSRNYDVTLFLGIKSNWARTPTCHFCNKIKHRSMAHIKLSHIQHPK